MRVITCREESEGAGQNEMASKGYGRDQAFSNMGWGFLEIPKQCQGILKLPGEERN